MSEKGNVMTDDLTALREQLSRVPESELYVRVDKRDLQSLLDRLERAEALATREGFLRAVEVSLAQLRKTVERAQRAEAAIERVRDIHRRVGASWPHEGGVYVCSADNGRWPCRTVAALDTGKETG